MSRSSSRASSSTGRAPVLQTGGCWFESSLPTSPRRIAQRQSACLIRRRSLVRLQLRHSHVAVAQPVERSPETRGVAGSIPAGHTLGSVAQPAEPPTLNRAVQVRLLPGPLFGRTATGAVPRLENGWAFGLGGSTPSPSALRSGVVESARRATVTRESAGSSPAAGASHAPVVEREMTPGSQPGSCGFESRRGYSSRSSGCGGAGHPAGFGRRRSQVRLLPARP